MATSSQKRKGLLASAAGLTPKETKDTASKFAMITANEGGPFKAGETLSTKLQITEYLAARLEALNEEPTKLTSDQIWTAIQVVSTVGMETPDEIEDAYLGYLDTIETTNQAPLTDLQRDTLFKTNTIMAAAKTLGEKADEQLEEAVQVGIDGKLDWNGSPLVIVGHLERIYGNDILSEFPPIGTRNTGKKNKKGQYHKDEVPAGYNGRTDYFMVDVNGSQKMMRFTQVFVESMPDVAKLVTEKTTVKTLMSGTELATVPEKYAKFIKGATPDLPGLQGALDDLTMQISSHVNRISQGLALWQVQQKFNELDKIDWEYVDGTAEATARRTKPIQLYALEAGTDKKGNAVVNKSAWPKPLALSGFIRLAKFIPQCKMAGGQLKTLMSIDTASRKKEPETPAVANTNNTMPALENVDQFTTALSTTFDYVENHTASIKLALQNNTKAGELAMWLVYVADCLADYLKDPSVRELAAKHDKTQRDAMAKAMGQGTKAA